MAERPAGFWSYVHADNAADGERITRLAQQIRDEYALITGEEIEVFVDRSDLRWGDEWRGRIDEALQGTAFFIPVITPRYFTSNECRRELQTFAAHAESLHVSELVLPLVYIDVPALTSDSPDDELIALVSNAQYFDWTDLRLEDETSTNYRRGVHKLATRLVEIGASVAEKPVTATIANSWADEAQDDTPGFVDVMAGAEEAMPLWNETIEEFARVLAQIASATTEASERMARSERMGKKGFAGRLVAARALAKALEEPAAETLQLGKRYVSELSAVDSGILSLIRLADEGELSQEDAASACGLFQSLREFAQISTGTVEGLEGFLTSLAETAGLSRDLRPRLNMIADGVRRVTDAQSIIDEWIRQIDQSSLSCQEHNVILRRDHDDEAQVVSAPSDLDVGGVVFSGGEKWFVVGKEPGVAHGIRALEAFVCEPDTVTDDRNSDAS